MSIAVGTSGWSYKHWRGEFYPAGLAARRWLEHYVEQFTAVEVNATFYRLPAEHTVRRWHDTASPGFAYCPKGSRLITHARRLRNCEEAAETFLARLKPLGAQLGAVLWQLPPDLERDDDLLDGFLAILPRHVRHAVEFRHRSWYAEGVYEVLRSHRTAHVGVSSLDMPATMARTADFVYVRLHGLAGGFEHDYTDDELAPWAATLRAAAGDGLDGYVFFNNDGRCRAPANARALAGMLSDR